MEIKTLKSFITIAREGSLTDAAEFLRVSQPTLSRQLKELETELGTRLFERGSHSIRLTEDGIILRKRAEEILDLVDKTGNAFGSKDEDTVTGDVYIGGGETNAMSLLADLMYDLNETNPQIHFHLYSGMAEQVAEQIDKGLLDFGLLIQPADLSKYHCLNLPAKDTWGLVMKKDHPLAEKKYITPSSLIGVPIICSKQALRQTLSRNEFTAWFGSHFDKMNIVATYNLIFNATLLVRRGIGCVFTLENLVYTGPDSGLCFRPLKPKVESYVNVVWKKYQVFSPAAQLFLDEMRARFEAE